ncbi:3737_t:CDS:2, partial [Cetraspora pellucida]
MVIEINNEEELVTENVKKPTSEKRPDLPKDWIIMGANQELIRQEYLRDTSIDLGYTKPLNLQKIEKEKNANQKNDRKVVKLKPHWQTGSWCPGVRKLEMEADEYDRLKRYLQEGYVDGDLDKRQKRQLVNN